LGHTVVVTSDTINRVNYSPCAVSLWTFVPVLASVFNVHMLTVLSSTSSLLITDDQGHNAGSRPSGLNDITAMCINLAAVACQSNSL